MTLHVSFTREQETASNYRNFLSPTTEQWPLKANSATLTNNVKGQQDGVREFPSGNTLYAPKYLNK